MNIVLESLFLRRPRIEYVSPAVCPTVIIPASASGFSFLLSSASSPCVSAPPALFVQNNFLYWRPLPSGDCGGCGNECNTSEICFSIYQALDATNPATPYALFQACVPPMSVVCCIPGCYFIAAIDANGIELSSSPIICGNGPSPIFVSSPVVPGADTYNLFFQAPGETDFTLVLSGFFGEAYQVCGCTKLVTPTGSATCGICLNQPYSEYLMAGPLGSTFTWTLDSGALPTGLTLHGGTNSTGKVLIDGVPTVSGTYSFAIRATDVDGGHNIASFSFDVMGITTTSLPTYAPLSPYFTALTATGGSGNYMFSLVGGALPPGLVLDTTGFIHGVPAPLGSAVNPLVFAIQDLINPTCSNTGCPLILNMLAAAAVLPFDSMETYSNGAPLNTLNDGAGWSAPYVSRTSPVFAQDTMETYSNGVLLDGLNGGANWSAPYVAKTGATFAQDTMESYSPFANLNGLAGGFNWLAAYVDRNTALPAVEAADSFETYSNGVALSGLSGGGGWSSAYVDRTTYANIWAYDTFQSYTNGSSLNGLNGGTNLVGTWNGTYTAR